MMRITTLIMSIQVACITSSAQQSLHVPTQYPTVQLAIQAAVPGDTVLVAAGIYHELINFLGKSIVVKSEDGPNTTHLCGVGMQGSVVSIISGEGTGAVLDGFTVGGGSGTIVNLFIGGEGGGINIVDSSPIIQNCRIVNNFTSPSPIQTSTATNGGGIRCFASFPSGVAAPIIRDCEIIGNQSGTGAGIVNWRGNLTIERCRIEGNHMCEGFYGGGGLSMIGGACVVRESSIVGNFGGACATPGAGILVEGGQLTIRNTVVAFNVAGSFPGILINSGNGIPASMIADHCVIYGNVDNTPASPPAGGIVASNTLSAPVPTTMQLTNSIVRSNSGIQVLSLNPPIVANCNIQGGYPGTNIVDVNPQFIDAAAGDFHLDSTSPCIGAAGAWLLPAVDRDGNARPFDGSVDIGAYEYVAAMPPSGAGTVGASNGGPFDVVRINGSSGGFSRRIDRRFGDVIALNVTTSPTVTGPSRFILWGRLGAPSLFDRYPTVLGDLSFTPAIVNPEDPTLFTLANSFWIDPFSLLAATPSPWTRFVTLPPVVVRLSIQGVIEETTGTYAITNGIVLDVSP